MPWKWDCIVSSTKFLTLIEVSHGVVLRSVIRTAKNVNLWVSKARGEFNDDISLLVLSEFVRLVNQILVIMNELANIGLA